jgi:hypothetical protein
LENAEWPNLPPKKGRLYCLCEVLRGWPTLAVLLEIQDALAQNQVPSTLLVKKVLTMQHVGGSNLNVALVVCNPKLLNKVLAYGPAHGPNGLEQFPATQQHPGLPSLMF